MQYSFAEHRQRISVEWEMSFLEAHINVVVLGLSIDEAPEKLQRSFFASIASCCCSERSDLSSSSHGWLLLCSSIFSGPGRIWSDVRTSESLPHSICAWENEFVSFVHNDSFFRTDSFHVDFWSEMFLQCFCACHEYVSSSAFPYKAHFP